MFEINLCVYWYLEINDKYQWLQLVLSPDFPSIQNSHLNLWSGLKEMPASYLKYE